MHRQCASLPEHTRWSFLLHWTRFPNASGWGDSEIIVQFFIVFTPAIICPWLDFGLPPRAPQVVWCHWGEIEPFYATLAYWEYRTPCTRWISLMFLQLALTRVWSLSVRNAALHCKWLIDLGGWGSVNRRKSSFLHISLWKFNYYFIGLYYQCNELDLYSRV